jgi:hypothetical protein
MPLIENYFKHISWEIKSLKAEMWVLASGSLYRKIISPKFFEPTSFERNTI